MFFKEIFIGLNNVGLFSCVVFKVDNNIGIEIVYIWIMFERNW